LESAAKAMGRPLLPGATGLAIRDVVDHPKYEKASNIADGSDLIGSDRCVREEHDLGNGDDAAFQEALRTLKPWNDGLTELDKLRALVREFNEESARIAF